MAKKDEEKTEEVKEEKEVKVKKPRKRKKVISELVVVNEPDPVEDRKIPDSGNFPTSPPKSEAEAQERAFKMKMDVVYKGDIYFKERNDLPEESKNYLKGKKGWSK